MLRGKSGKRFLFCQEAFCILIIFPIFDLTIISYLLDEKNRRLIISCFCLLMPLL